ncbi:MAG TPA: universal stress protein [Planctomycetota bacterium]|nr:universal stress protein [Planctomycetota bacterium]
MSKTAGETLFQRILVPLDGSLQAETILYQAQQLLCGKKGDVLLLHVWDAASAAEPGALATPAAAEKYLKGVESRLTPFGARVRRVLRTGAVETALLETIQAEAISLVALSSHGRRTSALAPVAGTIERIVRVSDVPVLVARAFQSGEDGQLVAARCEPSSIRRILVPLDGSSASEAVLPYARELGQLLGALMVLLHVDPMRPGGSEEFVGSRVSGAPTGPKPGTEASGEERIAYAAKTFSSVGLETMTLTQGGDPVSTILEFAKPSAVDLIALSTHAHGGQTDRLIGSVAHRVLKDSILPTLLLKAPAPA